MNRSILKVACIITVMITLSSKCNPGTPHTLVVMESSAFSVIVSRIFYSMMILLEYILYTGLLSLVIILIYVNLTKYHEIYRDFNIIEMILNILFFAYKICVLIDDFSNGVCDYYWS